MSWWDAVPPDIRKLASEMCPMDPDTMISSAANNHATLWVPAEDGQAVEVAIINMELVQPIWTTYVPWAEKALGLIPDGIPEPEPSAPNRDQTWREENGLNA